MSDSGAAKEELSTSKTVNDIIQDMLESMRKVYRNPKVNTLNFYSRVVVGLVSVVGLIISLIQAQLVIAALFVQLQMLSAVNEDSRQFNIARLIVSVIGASFASFQLVESLIKSPMPLSLVLATSNNTSVIIATALLAVGYTNHTISALFTVQPIRVKPVEALRKLSNKSITYPVTFGAILVIMVTSLFSGALIASLIQVGALLLCVPVITRREPIREDVMLTIDSMAIVFIGSSGISLVIERFGGRSGSPLGLNAFVGCCHVSFCITQGVNRSTRLVNTLRKRSRAVRVVKPNQARIVEPNHAVETETETKPNTTAIEGVPFDFMEHTQPVIQDCMEPATQPVLHRADSLSSIHISTPLKLRGTEFKSSEGLSSYEVQSAPPVELGKTQSLPHSSASDEHQIWDRMAWPLNYCTLQKLNSKWVSL